ncbi:putative sugar transporter, major facilitator superfamily [Campylobacter iguaniorum]|uniref:Putative sugar transporter, major facilitator superfamily n=1 Tax=Campylobacter iguaniorum TaxID=1244531 RepID=A0A076F7P3_9BACT|nr:MFS transporter [Campylobacter iguaniorum]AII14071.1 putative sugar transporter, major facilitator superfamily [Campylobacter iguaniorum]ALV23809.1 putative sugar transporter, major facilitator superfamily [Campylobacter iguaniorum]
MIKTVLPLSFITASRFFGLFIVLPVLSLYALNLKGANELLVGFLVGGYAITQMILQVPFGALSDKFGRKNTMTFGLVIFIIGSLVCAEASDIYTMIIGRLIQGSGAVGAVATAMISDFTPEEKRGHAMAIMGGMIGIAFSISMVLSPILSSKFGLASLFYLSALLSVFCIILLYTVVPKEPKFHHHDAKVAFKTLIIQKNLLIMNITNLMQKMLMSAAFVAIPLTLVKTLGYASDKLWIVYAASMVFGFVAMGLAGFLGDGKGQSKNLLLVGVVLFIIAYMGFAFSGSVVWFIVFVVVFFVGFNLHEPIMQSCASKFALSSQKGAALGVFNAFGYGGSFLGGVLGGYFLHKFDIGILALAFGILSVLWFVLLWFLTDPKIFKNLYLKTANLDALDGVCGIVERYKNQSGFVVKYNSTLIDENEIKRRLGL